MISPPSQLVLRNSDIFEQDNWAFINPSDADVFTQINNPKTVGLHQFHHHYSACVKQASQAQHFAAAFDSKALKLPAFDGVLIYMPKAKQQLDMLIQNAAALLKPKGMLMVVGENKAGIKSVAKLLEKVGETVNKIDSAKHCAIYAVSVEQPKASFELDDYATTRDYTINGITISLYTLPGVFGHKQLDPGTDLLLKQFPVDPVMAMKGEFYDFACGTGVIACYFAKVAHTYHKRLKVSMSDVSALAVYCSEKNVALNEVEATVHACDGFVDQYKRFDHIVSNPPFHDGIKNEYTITENFIKQAFSSSNPYANMTLVANRFLPYPDILDKVFKGFKEVAATTKYRVYSVTKPKK